jgi:phosphoglycolate phosphatase
MSRYRAVLFDMDGTLVHTAPDIASALNAALCTNGLAPFTPARIAELVGRGAHILVKRALSIHGIDDGRLAQCVFDDYALAYAERIGHQGHVFPGAQTCLRDLAECGIKLAVVTNALQRFAEQTLAHYGLKKYLGVIVGGDRCSAQKPHAAPLLFACRTLGVTPAEALMVGDSSVDVAAARAAGCGIVCVPHGYNEGHPSSDLDSEIIAGLDSLSAWLLCDKPAAARKSTAA